MIYKYDYAVVGRWTNHANIKRILDNVRSAGKTAYCFIDNEYDEDGIKQTKNPDDSELAASNVAYVRDWKINPTFRKMYENDMDGIKNSEALVFVFPAGSSAHIELGAAYGMGKKCYGIGQPEKVESLYLLFEEIYPDVEAFLKDQVGAQV